MLVPLIGLILGLLVLLYAVLAYTGNPRLQSIPVVLQQRNNLAWVVGCVLLALALMLGIVGYLSNFDASTIRLIRILLGAAGICVLGSQLVIRRRLH